ncbi:MAG TPA: TldD/PmbA family protein [Armatimonadota bacterium]|jgi:predicted Zn-dependent protease
MSIPDSQNVTLSQDQAEAAVEKVLSLCQADQAEVTCHGFSRGSTRYANNVIIQNLARTEATVSLKAAFGQRAGRASTSDFSPAALERLVRRAEEIARLSEPDPELMPALPTQQYLDAPTHFASTAAATPAQRADAVKEAADHCEAKGLRAAGSYTTENSLVAMGSSAGLRACHRETSARFLCTALSSNGSGWAESNARDLALLDYRGAAARAAEKALAAENPGSVKPRPYTVVMEPAAIAELIEWSGYTMDAKEADEGTSAWSDLQGQQIGTPLVTLRSDPSDPRCPVSPFFGDGMAAPKVDWITQGKLNTLAYSRYWAEQKGRPFTGRPTNLIMEGGDTSLGDLISQVEDGLLITRFWYIRFVEPKKLLLTGMTRDGLFRIEGGKVTGAVTNLRFNESPLRMLQRIRAVGQSTVTGEGMNVLAPAVLVDDFNFSSGTSF